MPIEQAFVDGQLTSGGETEILALNSADNGGQFLVDAAAVATFIAANDVLYGKKVVASTPPSGAALRVDLEAPAGSAIVPDNATPSILETVNFEATLDAPTLDFVNAPFEYHWDFGDGVTKATTVNAVSHAYAAAGTYTVAVLLVNSIGNATVTEVDAVTVS